MSTLRILVVDENVEAATMHVSHLRTLGHLVLEAYSGLEALQTYPQLAPQLVLLDIGTSDMDGRVLARQLRAQPGGDNVFIVALTEWGELQDPGLSADACIDLYLVKPLDGEQLRLLVSSDLNRRKP